MNILQLPNEILARVASMLPLHDRKSLASTCRRMNEVAFGPGVVNDCVLRLSKVYLGIGAQRSGLQEKLKLIPQNVLARSKRCYRNVRVDLTCRPEAGMIDAINKKFDQALKKYPVRVLYVYDRYLLRIVEFLQRHPILFLQLEGLSVRLHSSTIRILPEQTWTFEKLRWVEWYDSAYLYHSTWSRNLRINLYAPLLQKALFAHRSMPVGDFAYRCVLRLKTFENLRTLACMGYRQAYALLTTTRLSEMKTLCIYENEPVRPSSIDLQSIASNLPNLQTVMLRSAKSVINQSNLCTSLLPVLLEQCTRLRKLHLVQLDLKDVIVQPSLFTSIEEIHLHECFVSTVQRNALVLELPNVRLMCIAVHVYEGILVFKLPLVEDLTIRDPCIRINILETPMLRNLQLHACLEDPLVFMTLPMPNMKNLILNMTAVYVDWDPTFRHMIRSTGKLTRMTLACTDGRFFSGLLENIQRTQPELTELMLYGQDTMAHLSIATMRSILQLPQLQVLELVNLDFQAVLSKPLRLPPTLKQLRIRAFSMPAGSPFLVRTDLAHLGELIPHNILGKDFYQINASETPTDSEIRDFFGNCFDETPPMDPIN